MLLCFEHAVRRCIEVFHRSSLADARAAVS
jgi:hypothetical protein